MQLCVAGPPPSLRLGQAQGYVIYLMFPDNATEVAANASGDYKPDMERARYQQPRWMNAIVIVWSSLVIAGWVVLPKEDARILALAGVPAMPVFVAISNKIRAGAFAPRLDELRQIKAAQERSRFEQLFIAFLVTIASPFAAGLLAWALGNLLRPDTIRVGAVMGLAGVIGGLVFAILYVVRVLRAPAQQ